MSGVQRRLAMNVFRIQGEVRCLAGQKLRCDANGDFHPVGPCTVELHP